MQDIVKLQSIGHKLKLFQFSKIVNPGVFQNLVKDKIYRDSLPAYYKLRLLEGIYTSQNKKSLDLMKIISNPQSYTHNFKDNSYINQLLETLK